MDPNWTIDDPILDEESGARLYAVHNGEHTARFSIVPVPREDGGNQWVLQSTLDPAMELNPAFEPYDTEQEAYQAGLRAVREILG